MVRTFSDDFKEQVRSRTDIVSLIGASVALHTRGRFFVGLCPFHTDHNPSMNVYPDRQSYRCWSCGAGGDCFAFVMNHERVEFREALEILAAKAGLEMPKSVRDQSGGGDRDSKQKLFDVIAWAENEFHEFLLNSPVGERARQYLASRHLTAEMITKFRLGYHPQSAQWLLQRARNKFTPEQLLTVRLVGKQEDGNGYYDNFRDRVLFPIRDGQSRPVAFGGRILPDSPPSNMAKYWNSPEHPVFSKSRLLYGLDVARDAITKLDTAVVMEGYTDCITAHQAGVQNVVATLGTALAETHVAVLKRFARKVVLVYDGDEPGVKAAERAISKFLALEVDLRILTLPDELDPADFLNERGGAAFTKLMEDAPEAWDYKLRALRSRYGSDSIDARHRVMQEMLDVLCEVPLTDGGLASSWQLRENVIIGKLSQTLSVPEYIVRQQLSDRRSKAPVAPVVNTAKAPVTPSEPLFPKFPTKEDWMERELLEIIFIRPETVAAIRLKVLPTDLLNPHLSGLLELCFNLADEGKVPSYEQVTAVLEDPQLKSLAAMIDEHAQDVQNSLSLIEVLDYFQRRREHNVTAAQVNGPHLPETQAGLDNEAKLRLRAAMELNRKRIIKKTLT